ncbi:hypothetical protein TH61_07740 [Rufibacter sp. DG15C]|uniref:tetratricopeptide repeat protein n=1 Tax=Rufibacter sp. DG15C TaxID=1379909 RepID=UPI00078E04CE|nr:tetratricopeptide repeat protein [Rufibacter sp. DG15C]AMM51093.1 hypothetical protein TH61_07740 [Rufibacter sp. DG15C]
MIKNWKKYGILAVAFLPTAGVLAYGVDGQRSGEFENSASSAYVSYTNLMQDSPAMGLVKQGKEALLKGDAAGAQQFFDKALALTKNKDASVMASIGEAYVDADAKDLAPAIKVLEEAVKKDPKNAAAFVALGDAYLKQSKDGGKALSNYDKAIAANPKFAKAHLRRGQLYGQSRNFTAAKESLDAAIAADANYAPAYLEFAELYYRADQLPKSAEYIKKYVTMAENTPETRAKYASILYLTKDYTAAQAEIDNTLKVDPNNIAMNRLKGYILVDTKQNEKALEAMTAYFSKYDESKRIPSDYEYYANALVANNKNQEAVDLIMKAKQVDPKNPLYDDLLAKQYTKLKNYPKAIEAYKAKFSTTPPTNTDLFYFGQAHELNNQFQTADSIYTIITTKNPNYAYGHFWRARANAYIDTDSKQGLAKPHYEKFIELTSADKEKYKKDLVIANNYLGYYYYTKKDKANATKYWLEAQALDPTNADAINGLKALK